MTGAEPLYVNGSPLRLASEDMPLYVVCILLYCKRCATLGNLGYEYTLALTCVS
jgi:hypothetical protein